MGYIYTWRRHVNKESAATQTCMGSVYTQEPGKEDENDNHDMAVVVIMIAIMMLLLRMMLMKIWLIFIIIWSPTIGIKQ